MSRRAPASSTIPRPPPSRGNAATRRAPCSAPRKKPSDLRFGASAGSRGTPLGPPAARDRSVIQITDAAAQPLYCIANVGNSCHCESGQIPDPGGLFLYLSYPIDSFSRGSEENPMPIRKIAQASAFAAALGISLWASAASAQSQSVKSDAKYAPIQSIRYDFGSKSMSGYFVDQAKKCVVMLMVTEKGDPDAAPSGTATRVRLVLNPGQAAGLDRGARHRGGPLAQLHLRRRGDGADRR